MRKQLTTIAPQMQVEMLELSSYLIDRGTQAAFVHGLISRKL